MGKDIRKIVQCGKSVAITLPVEYLRANNLKLKDEIEVIYDGPVLQATPLNNAEIRQKLKAARASA